MSSPARPLTFSHAHNIDVTAAIPLYESVGWTAYTSRPELFLRMFEQASHVITTWDGSHLVGLVRLVGDGVTIAVVQDLLVDPSYQRRGIGRELLRRALAETQNIRQRYITTDADTANRHVVKFYEEHGFRPGPEAGLITLALLS